MSIKNLINKAKIDKLEIEYQGEKDFIYIKPLMAGDKADLLKHVTGLMSLKKRIDESKEKDKEYEMTSEEIVNSTIYKMKNAFYILCDENGNREYDDFQTFINETPTDLMDIVCEAIDENVINLKDEEIEKN